MGICNSSLIGCDGCTPTSSATRYAGARHHGRLRRDLSGNKLQNFSVNEFLRVAGQLEELYAHRC